MLSRPSGISARAGWRVPANPATEPVSYGAVLDGELVFVPGEIPRRGVFAHWGRGTGSAKVELVFPGGTYGIRKRLMSADLIPLAEALPSLLAVEASERTRQSSRGLGGGRSGRRGTDCPWPPASDCR